MIHKTTYTCTTLSQGLNMWVRLYNQATEVATEEKGPSILDLVIDCKSVTNKNPSKSIVYFLLIWALK